MRKIFSLILVLGTSYCYGQNIIDNYLTGTPVYTVIASSTNSLDQPRDLDFKPFTNELWIINKGNSGGGTNVIIFNAGESNQSTQFRKDSHSGHFMIYPASIAFGENGGFANINEIQSTASPSSTFMGPALWSSDTSIFARVFQNNWEPGKPLGSHLDMLHQSPFGMGIAHDSGNVYWISDGHNGNLCKYDFGADHSPGYDDHSNGKIWRYTDVPLTRQVNIPGHMIKDKATGWLYMVDAGTKKLKRVNTNTGSVTGTLTVPGSSSEPLVSYSAVTGAVVQVLDSFLTSQPSGIDLYNGRLIVGDYTTGDITVYDITGTSPVKLGVIATGQNGMMGLKIGTDGKIWFVNYIQNNVIRIDPSTNVNNDIAVVAITAPVLNSFTSDFYNTGFNECSATVTPVITIKNTGANNLTSATINYKIDNGANTPFSWSGLLATGATATVTLPLSNVGSGAHTLTVEAVNPNSVADANPANNKKSGAFRALNPVSNYPLTENFTAAVFPPTGWTYLGHNFHNEMTRVASVGGFGSNTGCVKMDNFTGADDIEGQRDYLMTPRINFTNATTTASLSFAVAYAPYASGDNDALSVNISTDCGDTWTSVYSKSGSALSTGSPVTTAFTPSATQWRTESVSLAAYAGQSDVIIQFLTTSDFGNNLYIDDINISNTTGISEPGKKPAFACYPNPVNDILTIEAAGNIRSEITVTVFDLSGKLVKSQQYNTGGKMTLDLSAQISGTYIVKIVSAGYTHQEKITVIK